MGKQRKGLGRRTPRGVRGLKLASVLNLLNCISRTPRGVRGLKSPYNPLSITPYSRTPRGVRGLKYAAYV